MVASCTSNAGGACAEGAAANAAAAKASSPAAADALRFRIAVSRCSHVWGLPSQRREQRRVGFNPAPEVADAQVLVVRVLAVVVVDNGHADDRAGRAGRTGASGRFRQVSVPSRRRPRGPRRARAPRPPRPAGPSRCASPGSRRRSRGGRRAGATAAPPASARGRARRSTPASRCAPRTRANLAIRVDVLDQTDVARRLGAIRHDVLRLVADIRAAKAADVQRRLVDEVGKRPAAAFGLAELQLAHQFGVVLRQRVHRGPLARRSAGPRPS